MEGCPFKIPCVYLSLYLTYCTTVLVLLCVCVCHVLTFLIYILLNPAHSRLLTEWKLVNPFYGKLYADEHFHIASLNITLIIIITITISSLSSLPQNCNSFLMLPYCIRHHFVL